MLKDGLRTVENNMYLVFHVLAELLVVGSGAMLTGHRWGRTVGLLGLGAVIYSTVNSTADTIRNRRQLTPLLVNLALAAILAAALDREPRFPSPPTPLPRSGRGEA